MYCKMCSTKQIKRNITPGRSSIIGVFGWDVLRLGVLRTKLTVL